MRDACVARFAECDGVIAAAAVCDYKPLNRVTGKISKTGGPITLEMIETDDVLAELGRLKGARWVLGFALEAANARENALQKLRAKNCDWIVLNGPAAIGAENNSVEVLDASGRVVTNFSGTKTEVARHLISWIEANVPRAKRALITQADRLRSHRPYDAQRQSLSRRRRPGRPRAHHRQRTALPATRPTSCSTTAW